MKVSPPTRLFAVALGLLAACHPQRPETVEEVFSVGTEKARIAVPYSEAGNIQALAFETRQKMEPLISLFDPSDENSEISTINRVAGFSGVPVSKDTMRLLKHAVLFGELSKGSFDITTHPVSVLWGFQNGTPPETVLSEPLRIAALQGVGYDKIELEDHFVRLTTPYTRIDVSCLTASYALDIAVLSHRSLGTPSLLLQRGSDTRVLGERSPESPWSQPLKIPQTGQAIGTVQFAHLPAVHVKEPSRESVEISGKKFFNNINPKTGEAVNHNFLVITAAKSATKAAALAHALVRHEVRQAQEIVDNFGQSAALVIPNGEPMQIWLSDGAEKTFRIDPALATLIQHMRPAGGNL